MASRRAFGSRLADLWELSRPRIEDNAAHTEAIVDRLFPDNPLLCRGKSSREFDPARARRGAGNCPRWR